MYAGGQLTGLFRVLLKCSFLKSSEILNVLFVCRGDISVGLIRGMQLKFEIHIFHLSAKTQLGNAGSVVNWSYLGNKAQSCLFSHLIKEKQRAGSCRHWYKIFCVFFPFAWTAQALYRRHPDQAVPLHWSPDRGWLQHPCRHLEYRLHGEANTHISIYSTLPMVSLKLCTHALSNNFSLIPFRLSN